MFENIQNSFNGMFGKIGAGMCRLSMNGEIAVKTNNGYKTYNPKTNRLTNCDSFVFDIGEEFFFVIPTNKVAKGDIIIVSGKPKCVVSSDKETIKVINSSPKHKELLEQYSNNKKEEVEKAYQRYQEEQDANENKRQEEEAAHSEEASQSMRMGADDDDEY